MCNLSKEKSLLFLFHSLTLSLFLSIFRTAPPAEALSFLCFALSRTHTQLHSCFSSLFCFSSQQGRMAFAFLLFCFVSFSVSHTPKSLPKEMAANFGTLLIEKLDLSMLWSLLIKWKNLHWRLLEQAHEWALTVHVGWTHTVRHTTLTLSLTNSTITHFFINLQLV